MNLKDRVWDGRREMSPRRTIDRMKDSAKIGNRRGMEQVIEHMKVDRTPFDVDAKRSMRAVIHSGDWRR